MRYIATIVRRTDALVQYDVAIVLLQYIVSILQCAGTTVQYIVAIVLLQPISYCYHL